MAQQEFIQNIAQILLQARDEIRANMQAKGINASGRTSAALEVVQGSGKIALVKTQGQNAPFGTLQYGRAGGRVPAGFYEILKQWSRDKGLSFSSEQERGTFAYFLARKIAREGTQRHRSPRNDIYDETLEKAVDGVRQEARKYVLGSIKAVLASGYVDTNL
jgi:hypothetical protein